MVATGIWTRDQATLDAFIPEAMSVVDSFTFKESPTREQRRPTRAPLHPDLRNRDNLMQHVWDTSALPLHLWGMVAELSSPGGIPATTVADAVAGDAMAFARIVRAHHDDMARVCQLICGDAELAQDATQAAWPIIWRKLGSLRDPDKLRPWLISVAANEARQMVRRLHRDRVVSIEVADIRSDHDDPAWRSTDDDLVSAIRRLPEEDRTLIALRYVSGFDASEIAPMLGLSPSGVRTRLSRVVARLRQEVDR